MILPSLTDPGRMTSSVETFAGYDNNTRSPMGTFRATKNLSSSEYPVLSVRKPRSVWKDTTEWFDDSPVLDMYGKEALYYVQQHDTEYRVYKAGDAASSIYVNTANNQFVNFGSYLIIFPDMVYINTIDPTDTGSINKSETIGNITNVHFRVLDSQGRQIASQASDDPPEATDRHNGHYWIDTSNAENPQLYRYYSSNDTFVPEDSTVQISGIGDLTDKFSVGDVVEISAQITAPETYEGSIAEKIAPLLGKQKIISISDGIITVQGIIDANAFTITDTTVINSLTISRRAPLMDFVIESGNRLWGCRHGLNRAGEYVNEIYASKLGDFRNWDYFESTAADSYVASVGSDGDFTGAVNMLGYPVFFKENFLHKVYGSFPSEYQVQTSSFRGVQKGSDRSLAIVDDTMYYLSPGGVMSYNGTSYSDLSAPFGGVKYSAGVGGAVGRKYYLNMLNADTDERETFVFDAMLGVWHREDEMNVHRFTSVGNDAYMLTSFADGGVIYKLNDDTSDEIVPWYAETNDIYYFDNKKYISRINVRLKLDPDSLAELHIKYDNDEHWELVGNWSGKEFADLTIPVKPRRCDHFRLRFNGTGQCRIYSYTKTFEQGSDRR